MTCGVMEINRTDSATATSMARPYGRSHVCSTERREMPNLKVCVVLDKPGFSREQHIATMTSALSSIVGP